MRMQWGILGLAISCLLLLLALSWRSAAGPQMAASPEHAPQNTTPLAILREVIPETAPNAEQLRRGQYLVVAGDCMSCHLTDGGEPLAGGLALKTPFGVIYSSNITSDRD